MLKKVDMRETVCVISDYSYKSDNSNETISLKVGEEYQLIKKVNNDWWYVQRGQSLPPFYIPANYVKVVQKGSSNIETGGKSPGIGGGSDKAPNVVTGEKSPNVVTGEKSPNVVTGEKSPNAMTGEKSPNAVTGEKSPSVVIGEKLPSVVTGEKSLSVVTGGKTLMPTGPSVTSPTTRVPPKPKPRVSKSASEEEVLDEAIDDSEVRDVKSDDSSKLSNVSEIPSDKKATETYPDKEKANVSELAKSASVESVVKLAAHPPFPNPPSLTASSGLPSSTGSPAPSGSSGLFTPPAPLAFTPPISPTDEINYVNLDEYQQMVKERKNQLIDSEITDTTVPCDNPAESETSDYRSGDSKGGSRESLDSDSQGKSCDVDSIGTKDEPEKSILSTDESVGKPRADPIVQTRSAVVKAQRGGNVGTSDYANIEAIRRPIHPQNNGQTSGKNPMGGTSAFEVPSGWTVEVEDGVSTFTNNALGQKWTSAIDKDGRNYFYNVSTHVTVWNLTDVPTSVSSSLMRGASSSATDATAAAAARVKDHRTVATSSHLDRSQSAWARHGLLNKDVLHRLALSGKTGNRLEGAIAEAEPNLSEAAAKFPALEPLPIKMVQKQGPLGKAKIDLGKKSKKPAWSQSYAVLLENGLYFYKDQKLAAGAKPKSVNSLGKPELILDLTDAQLSSSPDEKKNQILVLTLSKGDVFLLHNESEDVLQHWKESLENNIAVLVATPAKDVKDLSIMKAVEVSRLSSYIGVLGEERLRIADKLLHWLKRRPTKETLQAKGILKEAVFGSSLTELCEREKTKIPRFVHECIVAVEKRGLEVEGVYRVGGNMANVQKLRQIVDNNEFYELNSSFWDIHVVTGALKLFFRELSEPLFTFALFEAFLDAYKVQGRTRQVKAIRDIVRKLPTVHRETMKELFKHLTDVICHTTSNRMNTQALAIVFGPTLLWPEAKNKDINLAASMVYQGQVVEFMIIEFRAIFS